MFVDLRQHLRFSGQIKVANTAICIHLCMFILIGIVKLKITDWCIFGMKLIKSLYEYAYLIAYKKSHENNLAQQMGENEMVINKN